MSAPLRQHDQHAFLVLPENKLAVAAVKRMGPKVRKRLHDIVVLIGPAGVGKSRLLRDLLRSWEKEKMGGKAISVSASEYAAQFAEASSEKSIPRFQAKYRTGKRLFVCEDIQSLGPRKETQQQLLAAADEIISDGGCVVFTSTVMPGEIKGLSRKLVNRMHGGVCVNMEQPERKSRVKLIHHFLTAESYHLSEEQVQLIADSKASSAREILGLLTQLRTRISKQKTKNEIPLLEVLAEMNQGPNISLAEICRVTAKTFGVSMADLKGPKRSQTISLARQSVMFLARELAHENYRNIGAYLNRRNHSTVIHACQKIEAAAQTDPRLARDLESIRKSVGAK